MKIIDNPHDTLFHNVFGRPANAAELIRALLPPEVVKELDLTTVSVAQVDEVHSKLGKRVSYLVYSVTMPEANNEPLHLVVMRSNWPARFTVFEMLHHCVAVADLHIDDHGDLPMVVPLIVYHGKGEWSAPRRLFELYDGPPEVLEALRDYLMDMSLLIYEVARDSEGALRQRGMNSLTTLTLWALSRVQESTDIAAELIQVRDLIEQVVDMPDGVECLNEIMNYIINMSSASIDELERALGSALGARAKEISMRPTARRPRHQRRARA